MKPEQDKACVGNISRQRWNLSVNILILNNGLNQSSVIWGKERHAPMGVKLHLRFHSCQWWGSLSRPTPNGDNYHAESTLLVLRQWQAGKTLEIQQGHLGDVLPPHRPVLLLANLHQVGCRTTLTTEESSISIGESHFSYVFYSSISIFSHFHNFTGRFPPFP